MDHMHMLVHNGTQDKTGADFYEHIIDRTLLIMIEQVGDAQDHHQNSGDEQQILDVEKMPECLKNSFCYDIGVLHKHILPHFNSAEREHPFKHVTCKKECYRKDVRHYANMSDNPEDQNILWNQDSRLGENDSNNSENIFIALLQLPGNYAKLCSLLSRKTKEISKTIKQANALKIRQAPSVQRKIQTIEG
jgi:hypothetical protein